MFLKKGITRKTFLFAFLLVTLIISISLSILYLAMPGYYFYAKGRALRQNTQRLGQSLQSAASVEKCAESLAAFVAENNANVLSYDSGENMILELSSPFVSITADDNTSYYYNQEGYEERAYFTIIIESTDGTVNVRERALTLNFDYDQPAALVAESTENLMVLKENVNSDFVSYIMVSTTLQPIDEAKGVILSLIPFLLAASLLMGGIFAYFFARQLSKPIVQISDAAVQMSRLQPEAASNIRTDDELGELSRNLDRLYENLCQNIEDLKEEMEVTSRLERSKTQLMQSASHELKTPIAALGGILEGMIDNVGVYKDRETYLRECKGLVDTLSRLVTEILNASKTDLEDAVDLDDQVELGRIVDRVLETHNSMMQDRDLVLYKDDIALTLQTNEHLLHRVLSNLISNAVRYTPQGGLIRIALADDRLVLENQCPPIPEEELEKLFEPFYTLSYSRDKAESGTGLGLYIVKRGLAQLGIPYEAKVTELGLQISLLLDAAMI